MKQLTWIPGRHRRNVAQQVAFAAGGSRQELWVLEGGGSGDEE